MSRKPPFSVRLQDAETPLEYASAIAGETRSEFVRKAVRERAGRLLSEAREQKRGGRRADD